MHHLNKKTFKVIPLIFTCIFAVTSCDMQSASQNNNKTTTEQHSNQEEQHKEHTETNHKEYISPLPDSAPTFKVSIEKDDYPPFEYKNEYGVYIGYDFDLIRAIGEEAGFKVDIRPLPFSDVLPSLDKTSNASDIAISGLTASPERIEKYDASLPYIRSSSQFIVNANSNYQDEEQLSGKKIAVQKGGFQQKELESINKYEVTAFPTNFLAFQSVFTGKSEAFYGDRTMLMYLATQFPENQVVYIPHGDEITLSIFTKQGNTEVMNQVNKGLKALKANGRYQKINEKWFGSNGSAVAVN